MITITKEAEEKIKTALLNNPGKLPRICLKKGGCAGNMMILTLAETEKNDTMVEVGGVTFAVSEDTVCYIDDISIYVKNNLGSEIIIKNNKEISCHCGKSFKI